MYAPLLLSLALFTAPTCGSLTIEGDDITSIDWIPVEAPKSIPAALSVSIESDIDSDLATKVIAALSAVEKSAKVTIHINTLGGDLDSALKIVQAIERAGAKSDVKCVVDGAAYSAGFYILQSCPVRQATKRSELMAHEPYQPSPGSLHVNGALDLADAINGAISQYVEQCSARMPMGAKGFRDHIRGHDWWLTPKQALKLGAIDEVIPTPNTPKKK